MKNQNRSGMNRPSNDLCTHEPVKELCDVALRQDVQATLDKWRHSRTFGRTKSICDKGMLIGDLAINFHAKPRPADRVEILFPNPSSIPGGVDGFTRHHKGVFQENASKIQVWTTTPKSLHIPDAVAQIICNCGYNVHEGLMVASLECMIVLKLYASYSRRFEYQALADIEHMLEHNPQTTATSFDNWFLSDFHLNKLHDSIRKITERTGRQELVLPQLMPQDELKMQYVNKWKQETEQALLLNSCITLHKLEPEYAEETLYHWAKSTVSGVWFISQDGKTVDYLYAYQRILLNGKIRTSALPYLFNPLVRGVTKGIFFNHLLPDQKFVVTDFIYTPDSYRWFDCEYITAFHRDYTVYFIDLRNNGRVSQIGDLNFMHLKVSYWGLATAHQQYRFAIEFRSDGGKRASNFKN